MTNQRRNAVADTVAKKTSKQPSFPPIKLIQLIIFSNMFIYNLMVNGDIPPSLMVLFFVRTVLS